MKVGNSLLNSLTLISNWHQSLSYLAHLKDWIRLAVCRQCTVAHICQLMTIMHCKGSLNNNTDSLSWRPASVALQSYQTFCSTRVMTPSSVSWVNPFSPSLHHMALLGTSLPSATTVNGPNWPFQHMFELVYTAETCLSSEHCPWP